MMKWAWPVMKRTPMLTWILASGKYCSVYLLFACGYNYLLCVHISTSITRKNYIPTIIIIKTKKILNQGSTTVFP